ncbi:MAG: metallophosphoesterase [Bacteroidota bacterium]
MPWVLRVISMLWLLQLLFSVYVVWRINRAWTSGVPSRNSLNNRKRWVVRLVFLSFGIYPISGLLAYLAQGSSEILAYPGWMVYWYWFGLMGSVLCLNGMLVFDVIRLIMHRILSYSIEGWWRKAILGWVMLVMPYTAIKLYVDTSTILLDEHSIDLPELKLTQQQAFRIAHISDIQADAFTGPERLQAYMDKVEEANPDLIIFTGDVISYGTDYIATGTQYLSKLTAKYGVWSVMGDHDYWAGLDTVMSAMEANQLPVLEDEAQTISLDSFSMNLTGLLNVYSRRPSEASIDNLLNAAARDTSTIQLLISHQMEKSLARKASQKGIDLILSGHTHGGQLGFPFWGFNVSGPSLETDLLNGLYYINQTPLNINSGLGFTLAPVRFNAPAAVSILDIY